MGRWGYLDRRPHHPLDVTNRSVSDIDRPAGLPQPITLDGQSYEVVAQHHDGEPAAEDEAKDTGADNGQAHEH